MDTLTASQLCMVDLAPLIAVGDFRKLNKAEDLIDVLTASAGTVKDHNAVLCQLGTSLARVEVCRPESDAFVRALRASVRRRLGLTFSERRLTAGSAGA